MMRCSRLASLVLIAACGFHPSGLLEDAARTRDDGGADAHPDAGRDACVAPIGSVCGGKLWQTDFSTDPTLGDRNCDGVADFAMRDGSPLPGTLSGGVWAEAAGGVALDTEPKQNFLTRIVVDARLRATGAATSVGSHGAVFWINVDYDGTNMAPLFVDLQLVAPNQQTATVYKKTGGATEVALTSFTGLDGGMHDVHVDIVPMTLDATISVDNSIAATRSLTAFAVNGSDDRWATLVAYDASSEFDALSVEVCP